MLLANATLFPRVGICGSWAPAWRPFPLCALHAAEPTEPTWLWGWALSRSVIIYWTQSSLFSVKPCHMFGTCDVTAPPPPQNTALHIFYTVQMFTLSFPFSSGHRCSASIKHTVQCLLVRSYFLSRRIWLFSMREDTVGYNPTFVLMFMSQYFLPLPQSGFIVTNFSEVRGVWRPPPEIVPSLSFHYDATFVAILLLLFLRLEWRYLNRDHHCWRSSPKPPTF